MKTELQINRNAARWISLGVGILALLVGLMATIIGPLNTAEVAATYKTVSYVAFILGALGVVAFVLLDPQSLVEAATGRSGQYTITTWLMALFFTALVIAVYIILRAAAITPLDLTQAQKYQMTDQTRKILQGLKDNVQVIAFYPNDGSTDRQDAELWLKQYKSVSNGKLDYQFVDPDKNPGLAQQLGMSRSGTMVFKRGDQKSEASTATEQDMTNALLHVLSGAPRKAYILTGNGERAVSDFTNPGVSQMQTLLQNANFTVTELNLLQTTSIPADANVVILPGPTSSMLQAQVDALDAYLQKGGGLIVMIDAGTLTSDDPIIKYLNDKWGITMRDDMVVDAVSQNYTGDPITPLVFDFDETSPITQGMAAAGRRILMTTARSLAVAQTPPANVTVTGLLSTAPIQGGSWGETQFQQEQPALRYDAGQDIPGPLTLGASAENSQTKGRVVVFGDTDVASNQALNVDKDNGDLILNSANWLSHKENLISLPTPSDIGTRTFDKITSLPVLILIAVGSACVIPLAMIGGGIAVWAVRRRRR